MTQDDAFKHISVDSSDDQEVVIKAGVARPVAQPAQTVSEEPVSVEPVVSSSTEKRDAYRPTTEEDLKAKGPFGSMQAVIVVLCLLGLAAFLIWNLMR